MKIEKVTTVNPMTTDGKVLNVGDKVIFNACGQCFAGIFQGISKRGAVQLKGVIAGFDVSFNVMPSSIDAIYKAEIERQKMPFEAEESEENSDENN